MIHEDEETYITRRGEVRFKRRRYRTHKGVRCLIVPAAEFARMYPKSLYVDEKGSLLVRKRGEK